MCTGAELFAIGAALTVASTAATAYGQHQQAEATEQYQAAVMADRNRQIEENYKLAKTSYIEQSKQLQNRLQQEGERVSAEQMASQKEAAQARATARVAAGEGGVAGLSVDTLLRDFFRQEAMFRDSTNRQLSDITAQTEQEIKGLKAQAEGRVQSIRPYIPEPIERPNYLGAALRIGGSVASQYGTYATKNPKTGKYSL